MKYLGSTVTKSSVVFADPPYNLSMDAFMLTGDVVLAMQNAGLDIADNPSSQRDLKKVQALMNEWHQQSGLPYTHISKIAAFSTGINYDEP